MKFSIVTPTLNAETYLSECLQSVRVQGLPDVEHLIVDGGSSDETEAIVRATGATWLSRPGLGQAAAINEGLRLARGDVVAWLNADDFYVAGSLAFIDDQLARNAAVDVVYGDCTVVNWRGALLWCERPGAYDFPRLLRRGNYLAQPSVFFRKRVFDEVGYLDESLNYAMDFEFWLRLNGRQVTYTPRVLAAFRWHSGSKTSNHNRANWREQLAILHRYGGGWTPHLVRSFVHARLVSARDRGIRALQRQL